MNEEEKLQTITALGAKPAKLKIMAFSGAEPSKRQKKEDIFTDANRSKDTELQINPESFSVSYAVNYNEKQGSGTSGNLAKWTKTPPRKLSFEFLLDGTGAIPNAKITGSIASKINEIEDVVFRIPNLNNKPVPSTRQPNFLWIQWSAFHFKCRLESMNITYKLFDANGTPLRASVNMSFLEVTWEQLQNIEGTGGQNTKQVTAKDADKITKLSKDNYGDEMQYPRVAIANKLVQFRNSLAGKKILFSRINDLND